ncbi:hypothetical protein WMF45_33735 [Sorangium sp. So ce448]|uniref:hypothetical protein n=1 Tax=Sorangium sp. So ce448 TaxID=3133314 RepID=UPI003F638910
MSILEKAKKMKIGKNDTSGTPSTLEIARSTHAAAEQEKRDTAECLGEAEAALAAAEAAYDAEPSEELGEKVIAARRTRDLAELRAKRARCRAEEAAAGCAAAEHAAAVAGLAADIAAAERALESASKAESEARGDVEHANPAPALRQLMGFNCTRERDACAAHERARSAREASVATLEQLEAKLLELAPERESEIAGRRKARASRALEELVAGASLAAVRRELAPSVEAIIAAEQIIREHVARIEGTMGRARADALRARELGADVEPINEHHGIMNILEAQFRATPDEHKNVKQHGVMLGVLSGAMRPDDMKRPEMFSSYQLVLRYPPLREIDRDSTHHIAPGDIDRYLSYPSVNAAQQGEADRRAARKEQDRAAQAAWRTNGQTIDELPPVPRTMAEIVGDYLPRVGGIVAPNMGRRAS